MENFTQPTLNKFGRQFFCLLFGLLISLSGFAQNVGINSTGAAPNASAGLDVDFPDKGLLIPRVALAGTASFAPIGATHVAGMIVYNTAAASDVVPGFYYNNGAKWIAGFPAGSAIGNMLYWNGANWVLVPAGSPGQYLQMSAGSIPTWGGAAVAATITTNPVTAITAVSATSGGNITSDGGSAVLIRGICWNSSVAPTIANSKTTDIGTGIGSFSNNMTGLLSGTTYYVRAYAINSSLVTYGNEISFITLAAIPTVAATTAATAITATTAATGGNVTANGGSPILERGVCYGTVANPTILSGTRVIDGAPGTGVFASSLTGLAGGTIYYVRAYASNSIGTAYGTQISFTTSVAPPSMFTTVATNLSGASATSGGSMNWNGGGYSNYQNYGVAYSTTPVAVPPAYIEASTYTRFATNTGNFTVNPAVNILPWVTNLTGLAANTTYYIRSYLNLYRSSPAGWITVYGNELTFTTTAPTAPVVGATSAATLITASTVRTGGAITSDGGSAIPAKGVCWGILPNPSLGVGNFSTDGSGTTAFVSNLTGLNGSTNYYVRAYATNAIGTTYSPADITFTTSPASPYTLGQNVGYGIVGYIAPDGSGFIVSPAISYTGGWGCSGTNIVGIGTAIGTGQANTDLIIANCVSPTAAGTAKAYTGGGFNDWYLPSSLEWGQIASHFTWYGLNSGNVYTSSQYGTNYLYASTYYNSGPTGTCYSSGALRTNGTFMAGQVLAIRNFSASPAIAPTIAATTVISGITATSATSGGIIASDGGSPITAKGVCWSTTINPTIAGSKTIDGTGTLAFVSSITGLTTGTPYYVRSYATNSVGTSYGPEISFTPVAPGFPNITTTAISNLGATSVTAGGNVITDGGSPVTERGVCWGTTAAPTVAGSKTIDGTGTGPFISSVTGLTTGALYYMRAYATNVNGTTYGGEITFTPFTLAVLTTDAITNLQATSATSGGNITSDGWSAVTNRGICFGLATAPTIADFIVADVPGTGTGTFISNMNGLTNGATYYARAYATNAAGTAYGNEVSFVPFGLTIPTLTTDPVTSTTSTGGISGGNITSDGGQAVTTRGVCWNQVGSPSIADSKTIDGSGTGTFTSTVTGLTAGWAYYIRAYATNSLGTAYGQEEFYIPVGLPNIGPGQLFYWAGDAFAQIGLNLLNDGGDPLTAIGAVWNTSPNPTVDVNGGISTEFLSPMPNTAVIQPLEIVIPTTYYIRAYATNSYGTSYSPDLIFTPGVLALPTVQTNPILNNVGALAEGSGTILFDGGNPITGQGLCWDLNANPDLTKSFVAVPDIAVFGASNPFYCNITGLTIGTTYHVRAYATNDGINYAYGADISFVATAAFIGQTISGGMMFGNVFSIDGTGAHGLITNPYEYLSTDWGCTATNIATGTAVGTGMANTMAIITDIGTNTCTSGGVSGGFAAEMAQWFGPDWYLPSKDEMNLLWTNRVAAGVDANFATATFPIWSSSQADATHAWIFDGTNWLDTGLKNAQYMVWVIRSF